MAQPNLVREPSMDEILASIRRIIESNDVVPSSGLATTNAEPEGFSGQVANDYGSDHEVGSNRDIGSDQDLEHEEITLTVDEDLIVEAFEAENKASEMAEKRLDETSAEAAKPAIEQEVVSQSRPLSLADVAARVRAASERSGALRDLQKRNETVAEQAASQDEEIELEPPAAAEAASFAPVEIDADDAASLTPEFHGADDDEEIELEPIDQPDVADVQAVALINVEEEQHSPSLLSPSIGDKVSRSFEDLAAAVHLSGRRTFDEIATELLRPMLQEWLDDNLPTLVERLVREEIERVARGPRR